MVTQQVYEHSGEAELPRYTYRDRQKSIATRRRNARLRREQIAKLGYNPNNPTVKLANNLVVTKGVENRLTKKAKSEELPIVSGIVAIWVFTFVLISRFPISGWSYIGLLPALVLTVFLLYIRRKSVKTHTIELAEERQKNIDEARQFYSSPEWRQVRSEVIREYGRICFECGVYIKNSNDVTVDHIRPRSKYPDLALDKQNLRVLCRSCNSSKGDRDSEIFVQ